MNPDLALEEQENQHTQGCGMARFLSQDHEAPPKGSSRAQREAGGWELAVHPSQRLHSGEGVLGVRGTLSTWRGKLLITNAEGKNW